MKLKAYVDGSYNSNNHTYGGGVVILMEGLPKPLEHKVAGNDNNLARLRNVAGEILGALAAVEIAKASNATELDIFYDYEGIQKWATGEWQANKIATQSYRRIVCEAMASKWICSKCNKVHFRPTHVCEGCDETAMTFKTGIDIRFHKVAAHTGDFYNELADKLAKEAARGE